jgi:hypothetical protein
MKIPSTKNQISNKYLNLGLYHLMKPSNATGLEFTLMLS